MNDAYQNTNSVDTKQKGLDSKTKVDIVLGINILEAAAKLGLEVVTSRCSSCLHNFPENERIGSIEFNIKKNTYKCNCLNEKGNVIQLVQKGKELSFDEAVEWLYENFILNRHKKPD